MKKIIKILLMVIMCAVFIGIIVYSTSTGDPTGVTKQTVAEIGDQVTLDNVAQSAASTKIGLNYVYMLLCGSLIFFFQAGFAMVETGFTRAKNANHTM
ncbi:MAG: ammonium transporter, partial [Clostridium sp.]